MNLQKKISWTSNDVQHFIFTYRKKIHFITCEKKNMNSEQLIRELQIIFIIFQFSLVMNKIFHRPEYEGLRQSRTNFTTSKK